MKTLLCSLLLTTLVASSASAAPAEQAAYNPDIDLAEAPAYYRKRVVAFRNMLRKETTREAKVQKAIAIAKRPKSKYVRDSIEFLGSVRSKKAVPVLLDLCRRRSEREFALHALTEIRDARALPSFVNYLSDPSRNVRGNAYRGFARTTKRTFSYRYDDAPDQRQKGIEEIKTWWEQNRATFVVPETTKDEAQEAEDAWKKYGQGYLHDLSR